MHGGENIKGKRTKDDFEKKIVSQGGRVKKKYGQVVMEQKKRKKKHRTSFG